MLLFLKICVAVTAILVSSFLLDAGNRVSANLATSAAVDQLKNPSLANTLLQDAATKVQGATFLKFGVAFFLLVLFWHEVTLLWSFLKMQVLKILATCFLCICATGCGTVYPPYHEDMLINVNTNETPFLIELQGDEKQGTANTQEYLAKKKVFTKQILVNYRLKQIGYVTMGYNHAWIPDARVILVDRSPQTRQWVSSGKGDGDGIWVESQDSIGCSTGITITARIENDDDAVLFLHNYPPQLSREIKNGTDTFRVDITAIESIMDKEIRGQVQSEFAAQAAMLPMDTLREKKNEVLEAVRQKVLPFFLKRGITITNIGQFGGFTYENPKTQDAIDKVYQAQQDEDVAKAETKAAEARKAALKLVGEGDAAKALETAKGKSEAVTIEAKAQADSVRLVAEAKAYELEQLAKNPEMYVRLKQLEIELKRLEKWDGRLPVYSMGGEIMNMMPVPATTK